MGTNIEALTRLHSKCDKNGIGGCWNWTSTFFSGKDLPYGQFWLNGKITGAHRASYALSVGEIPEGMHVLHRCNNSKCINPSHLYLGDHAQNMRDRDACGHTRKGEHRYNYRRFHELCDKTLELRSSGMTIANIKRQLGIGHGTYYRIRESLKEFPKGYFRGVY